jgi:hypothetical protein
MLFTLADFDILTHKMCLNVQHKRVNKTIHLKKHNAHIQCESNYKINQEQNSDIQLNYTDYHIC